MIPALIPFLYGLYLSVSSADEFSQPVPPSALKKLQPVWQCKVASFCDVGLFSSFVMRLYMEEASCQNIVVVVRLMAVSKIWTDVRIFLKGWIYLTKNVFLCLHSNYRQPQDHSKLLVEATVR